MNPIFSWKQQKKHETHKPNKQNLFDKIENLKRKKFKIEFK